jgi:hypothetical protein
MNRKAIPLPSYLTGLNNKQTFKKSIVTLLQIDLRTKKSAAKNTF